MKTCHHNLFAVAVPAPTRGPAPLARTALRSLAARIPRVALLAVSTVGVAPAQVGTNYCIPAPNSTGVTALIAGSGSASVPTNNLMLTSSNLPLNAAAFFLCSRTQGFIQNPGGSAGSICLGNPIGRLVGGVVANSGATGIVNVSANLNAMPQPSGAVVVMAGETWNFQCWFRDAGVGGGATSNFSDGLEVLFSGAPATIPAMVPIPPGTFLMGSNEPYTAPYFNDMIQQPVHQVTISRPFWMGQYEVTQAEYQTLMGANPSFYTGATRPVESVNWNQAQAYCAALTAQQAGNLPAGYEYRLPTEAEWEYACRAGTTTEFHYGPDLFCGQANIGYTYHLNPPAPCNNSNGTAAVGSYAPNAFGLYDMHGNVCEFVLDSYAPYSSAAVTDPFVTAVPPGLWTVARGGSLGHTSSSCRSAFREIYGGGGPLFGFRVVIAPVLVP